MIAGDHERRHSVRARLACREDDDAGDRGDDERGEVGEEVLEAPLDVHRAAVRAGEHTRRGQVHHDPDERDDEDRLPAGVGRRDQAADRLVDDQERQNEQRGPVGLRREDLCAAKTEGEVPTRRTTDEPDHDEAEHESAGVGEHVRGVRDERQRAGQDPDDHLDDHQPADQSERDPEAPRVTVPGRRVRVACVRMHVPHCPRWRREPVCGLR